MNINLNLLKYFYIVAKYNSYTRASSELNISQPSLSYSVKTLENQLNLSLFYKKNNKIYLTKNGIELYNKVEKIMDIIDSIAIFENSNELSGNISFGLRSSYATKIFPNIANKISKTYPNVKIDFVIGTSLELEKMLLNNQIDIVIDEREYDNCYAKLLGEYSSFLIASRNTFNKLNAREFMDFITKNDIYLVERNILSKALKTKYPNLKYKYVQSTPMLLDKIINDSVIGIGHELVLKEELKNNDIVIIKSPINIPKSKMYIECLNDSLNAKIKKIIDFYVKNNK